jgi:hypothetical protein
MQQYAAVLLEKARQRLAMRTAQEMDIGAGGARG